MMQRVVPLVFAATLVLATGAWAQTGHITGRVASVDTNGHSITFTDGRTVFLEPGAMIVAGNQQIALDAVRPGTNVVIMEPAVSQPVPAPAPAPQVQVNVQPGYVQPSAQPSSVQPLRQQPPINASGIVASVDSQTGVITFQDGRMVRATGQTFVWQREPLASVQPGQHVFLRGAEAVGFSSASSYWQGGQSLMGTVQSVDQTNNTIVLSDGTVVHLSPGAQLRGLGSQQVTISQLQPGSQIVIHVPAGSSVSQYQYGTSAPSTSYQYSVPSTGAAVSALPREALQGNAATISADNVLVVEGPEAP